VHTWPCFTVSLNRIKKFSVFDVSQIQFSSDFHRLPSKSIGFQESGEPLLLFLEELLFFLSSESIKGCKRKKVVGSGSY
jgi:hypothetical protein